MAVNNMENKICPKLDTECDMKCGFDIHISESNEENSNVCISCEG